MGGGGGSVKRPDLDPQDAAIWPLGQVHMLGLEQKPSPQELRQIAVERNVTPFQSARETTKKKTEETCVAG